MRSQDLERWLDRQGFTFRYVEQIKLADFLTEEQFFQNRAEDVSPETREEYTIAMNEGADFPPVLAIQKGLGYVIVDGHQRLRVADELGRLFFDAYVLDLSDDAAREFAKRVNLRHGVRLSRAARLMYALNECDRVGGENLEGIARRYDLVSGTLRDAYRLRQFERRAEGFGVPPGLSRRVPLKIKKALQTIKFDEPFAEFTRLVADTGLPYSKYAAVIRKVHESKSEKESLEHITQLREELKAAVTSLQKQKQQPLWKAVEKWLSGCPNATPEQVVGALDLEHVVRWEEILEPKVRAWIQRLGDALIKRRRRDGSYEELVTRDRYDSESGATDAVSG